MSEVGAIMEIAKIRLSPEELLLMQNRDWILTKNSVIEKVSKGFGELATRMQENLSGLPPLLDSNISNVGPKVSRGEKYQGLPYVILDYPRIFSKDHILAIRTLFWWGNYCSITLHAKGGFQELISARIQLSAQQLKDEDFYVSFSGDEWNHDLRNADYSAFRYLSQHQLKKNISGAPFLKLSAKVEIAPWDIMEKKLFDRFICLSELIKA